MVGLAENTKGSKNHKTLKIAENSWKARKAVEQPNITKIMENNDGNDKVLKVCFGYSAGVESAAYL